MMWRTVEGQKVKRDDADHERQDEDVKLSVVA